MTQQWLMKSEPSTYSIDDLYRDKVTPLEVIRNYLERNFMRDQMKIGDKILFYHFKLTTPNFSQYSKPSAPY